jgi:MoaA/NifB/PqqE/SkfB family radical SAM enzyme
MSDRIDVVQEPPDFGDQQHPGALILVTNACNLRCSHCFVYRDDTPSDTRDKISDNDLLYQLRVLRERHGIRSMLFMGGEPMIKSKLVFEAMQLFENSSIVTNGTYGIPSVPGHLVTVSLDGPPDANDAIRGEGVFERVRRSVFARDPGDGTQVILQMAVTRQNAPALEAFVDSVKDWPVDGVAFTFYVPDKDEDSELCWTDLTERDAVIDRVIALKKQYPFITASIEALELMKSDRCLEITGHEGENCNLKNMLPLYVGDGGQLERTFCCYGNNVDCSRCGAYAVFNAARKSAG